jgi:hypothetical protein
MSDAELNKAALLIAKLLIRTRQGKIPWKSEKDLLSQAQPSGTSYKAELDDGLEAHLNRDDRAIGFKLWGPPMMDLPAYSHLASIVGGRNTHEVISITLSHAYGTSELENPESIVYRDLDELIFLAENPKSVSDDLRYQQALTFLDKIAV